MLFDNPIFKNWFTDLMDVCRVVPVKDGNVTRQERKKVAEKVPCRVYHTGTGSPSITDNAARIRGEDKLSCDLSVDIQAGDELYVIRGEIPDMQTSRNGISPDRRRTFMIRSAVRSQVWNIKK